MTEQELLVIEIKQMLEDAKKDLWPKEAARKRQDQALFEDLDIYLPEDKWRDENRYWLIR